MDPYDAAADIERALVSLLDAVIPRYLRALRSAIADTEGPNRLTMPQVRCLQAIAAAPAGAITSRLAELTNVTVPTMSAMIDGLVGRSLVERRGDPESRRRVLLFVTAQGQELLRRYQAIMDERHLAIIAGLDPMQRARVLAAARDLLTQLDVVTGAPPEPGPGASS